MKKSKKELELENKQLQDRLRELLDERGQRGANAIEFALAQEEIKLLTQQCIDQTKEILRLREEVGYWERSNVAALAKQRGTDGK